MSSIIISIFLICLFSIYFQINGFYIHEHILSWFGKFDKKKASNCYAYVLGYDNKCIYPGYNRYINLMIETEHSYKLITDPIYLRQVLEKEGLEYINNPDDHFDKYLIMAFISKENDYHFFLKKPKQNYWTHKFRNCQVSYTNLENEFIIDPRILENHFYYDSFNKYDTYCGCFIRK
ncbi:hypothetical protein Hokovirus_1_242 [Hokovirus HKV1]|uniref:Uncharacterized protein n=1 Tax=Hokovirus HKV1 TaxID=1977638 RepID=A0A1V0SF80_9VIRU|nr:hypothetical protein Hokovirus_1_242 [Hokovirus HKV1]